jgi:hypothetical protein
MKNYFSFKNYYFKEKVMIEYIKKFRKSKYAPYVRGLVYLAYSSIFINFDIIDFKKHSIIGVLFCSFTSFCFIGMGVICIFEKRLKNNKNSNLIQKNIHISNLHKSMDAINQFKILLFHFP